MNLMTSALPAAWRPALMSALMLCAALGASAADVPKPAAAKPAAKAGGKAAAKPVDAPKPLEPVMSRAELRECMLHKARLRKDTTEVSRVQADLGREKSDIERDGASLKAELLTLDRSSAEAVEGYNSRARARDARIDVFQPKVEAFNTSVTSLEADRAAYVRNCDNKKYDEKDEIALQKELGL